MLHKHGSHRIVVVVGIIKCVVHLIRKKKVLDEADLTMVQKKSKTKKESRCGVV